MFSHQLACVALLSAAMLFGCSNHADHHAEAVQAFPVAEATVCDTFVTRSYVCQIRAQQHIEVRALERGYLQETFVAEGQRVPKGSLMFQIMPVLYEAEYKQKAAHARVLEIEYLNTKALLDKGVVSENELALAKAHLDEAQAEAQLAKAHVDFTRIRAPFTGIMDRLHVRNGSLVEEGEVLATLSDNASMWVYFNVPEAEYLALQTADTVNDARMAELTLANGMTFPHKGVITTIEADFDNTTGNIAYRATFPNPSGLLRHGETGNIVIKQALPGTMLIPQKATFEVLDKKYVYTVDTAGIVQQRLVHIQAELPHLYAVDHGVTAGERVLLEGLRKVRPGQRINAQLLDSRAAWKSLQVVAE